MTLVAQRLATIKASPTLAITAKAAKLKSEGKDIIGLGAGEPDFDTPQHIKDAAVAALNKGLTKYTPAGGRVQLAVRPAPNSVVITVTDSLRADYPIGLSFTGAAAAGACCATGPLFVPHRVKLGAVSGISSGCCWTTSARRPASTRCTTNRHGSGPCSSERQTSPGRRSTPVWGLPRS